MILPLGEPHSTSGLSQVKFLASALAFNRKTTFKHVQFHRLNNSTIVLRGQIISLPSS